MFSNKISRIGILDLRVSTDEHPRDQKLPGRACLQAPQHWQGHDEDEEVDDHARQGGAEEPVPLGEAVTFFQRIPSLLDR